MAGQDPCLVSLTSSGPSRWRIAIKRGCDGVWDIGREPAAAGVASLSRTQSTPGRDRKFTLRQTATYTNRRGGSRQGTVPPDPHPPFQASPPSSTRKSLDISLQRAPCSVQDACGCPAGNSMQSAGLPVLLLGSLIGLQFCRLLGRLSGHVASHCPAGGRSPCSASRAWRRTTSRR